MGCVGPVAPFDTFSLRPKHSFGTSKSKLSPESPTTLQFIIAMGFKGGMQTFQGGRNFLVSLLNLGWRRKSSIVAMLHLARHGYVRNIKRDETYAKKKLHRQWPSLSQQAIDHEERQLFPRKLGISTEIMQRYATICNDMQPYATICNVFGKPDMFKPHGSASVASMHGYKDRAASLPQTHPADRFSSSDHPWI
jgi:hypothetical protein